MTRAAYFRFCADGTLRGPDNFVAATYADRCWRVGQRLFRGFECPGPVFLRAKKTAVENPVQMGPFSLVKSVEDMIYADEECLQVCASRRGMPDELWHEITLLAAIRD